MIIATTEYSLFHGAALADSSLLDIMPSSKEEVNAWGSYDQVAKTARALPMPTRRRSTVIVNRNNESRSLHANSMHCIPSGWRPSPDIKKTVGTVYPVHGDLLRILKTVGIGGACTSLQ